MGVFNQTKGAVTFNGGYRGRKFSGQMEKFCVLHSLYSIICETQFEMLEKFHSPTIFLFLSFKLNLKLQSAKNAIWI